MIQEGKLLRVMTPEETVEWIQAWAAWRDREYAVLCSVGVAFNAAHVESIERGLSLMTAFQFTHEFVRHRRMFHDYSRAMGRMQFYMELISKELSALSLPESTAPSAPRRRGRPTKEEAAQMAREKAEREEREAVAKMIAGERKVAVSATVMQGDLFSENSENSKPTANNQQPTANSQFSATPDAGLAAAMAVYEQSGVRLHLDQLAWLMSEGLRQRVSTVASLRSRAAEESNQAKALAERGVAQELIEPHSRAAVEATTAYKEIYADVDRELGNLYSLLYIGGEHIPAYEERCRAKGITVSQLMAVLKPYWEKAGKPVVSLESVTPPSPEEEEKAKKARAARLHAIRTFFIRKDRKLTSERVEKMRAMITELQGYGVATEEYEAVLAAAEQSLPLTPPKEG